MAIEAAAVQPRLGSLVPEPFASLFAGRAKHALGDVFGLQAFGVNLVRLAPGARSALRHAHAREDEFVYVLEGEVVLCTDVGEQVLRAGCCAGFPAGSGNGHQLVNRSDRPAVYLEVGSSHPDSDQVFYPDVDLHYDPAAHGGRFTRKDGTPY